MYGPQPSSEARLLSLSLCVSRPPFPADLAASSWSIKYNFLTLTQILLVAPTLTLTLTLQIQSSLSPNPEPNPNPDLPETLTLSSPINKVSQP